MSETKRKLAIRVRADVDNTIKGRGFTQEKRKQLETEKQVCHHSSCVPNKSPDSLGQCQDGGETE